MIDISCCSD